MANLTQRVFANTAAQITSKVITTAASLVVIFYLTRYLGVAGFGDYTTIFAYLGIFGTFADLGFFLIVMREITSKPEEGGRIVGNIITFRLFLTFLVLAVAYGISFLLPYDDVLRVGILIGSLATIFTSLSQVLASFFQSRLLMYYPALADSLGRLAIFGLVLWFISLGLGLPWIVAAIVFGNLLNFVVSFGIASRFIKIRLAFDFKLWRKIFIESLPLGLVIIFSSIYFRFDTFLLSVVKGSYDVGIYGAAYKILEVLLTLSAFFLGAVFPIMARRLADDKRAARRVFQTSFDVLSTISWPLVIGTLILAKPIIALVGGGDFVQSAQVLQILIFGVGIAYLNNISNHTLTVFGYQRALIKPYFAALVFNVVANLILIPRYSYFGAAASIIATEVIVLIMGIVLVYRLVGWLPNLRSFARALVSALVMGAAVWLVRDQHLVVALAVGAISYGALAYFSGAINRQNIKNLFMRT